MTLTSYISLQLQHSFVLHALTSQTVASPPHKAHYCHHHPTQISHPRIRRFQQLGRWPRARPCFHLLLYIFRWHLRLPTLTSSSCWGDPWWSMCRFYFKHVKNTCKHLMKHSLLTKEHQQKKMPTTNCRHHFILQYVRSVLKVLRTQDRHLAEFDV